MHVEKPFQVPIFIVAWLLIVKVCGATFAANFFVSRI
jgi:hypothetical protein